MENSFKDKKIKKISEREFKQFLENKDDYDDYWTKETYIREYNSIYSSIYVFKDKERATLNNIIGLASISLKEDETEVNNICIRKDLRNMGYGKSFLIALINEIKYLKSAEIEKGEYRLILEVNENNIYAIQLYKTLGFEKIAIRKKYYGNNSAIIMSKSLHNN